MITGTHNTMTYRSPKLWYLRPFKWMARCQKVDYKTQHEKYGVNAFDIRLFWDKNGKLEFRHGYFAYPADDFDEILKYCEDNNIICRIIFEERAMPKYLVKRSEKMNLAEKFDETCKYIETKYPKLVCYSGRNCRTWKVIHKFAKSDPREIGLYSSVTSLFKQESEFLKKIDDFCPYIYAKLMNRKNMEMIPEIEGWGDNVIVQYDFINIS